MALEDAGNDVDCAITGSGRGLAYENPFAGVVSFLRRPYAKDVAGADLAISGIPFDQGVTHRPGARFGPRAIREASTLMAGDVPYGWEYSPLDVFKVVDAGDMAFDYARAGDVPARIETHVAGLIGAARGVVLLGGDHSLTLASLRAHAAVHGPLALCQIDAHPDTWSDETSDRVDHGTIIYRAVKEGLIDPNRSVQIGTRVEVEGETDVGLTRMDARAVHRMGADAVADAAKSVLGDAPVYLSFDIDGLDPAFAPGTGTPVWGGLSTAQAGMILRGLAGINLVGADVVEVSPPYDHAGVTALAGAHVAYDLIALWGWSRRG